MLTCFANTHHRSVQSVPNLSSLSHDAVLPAAEVVCHIVAAMPSQNALASTTRCFSCVCHEQLSEIVRFLSGADWVSSTGCYAFRHSGS